ncbi:MAG: PepSY-associated TM helix domain-containing protein [Pseudomonadota bacterium]
MNTATIRTFTAVHTWTGLASGLALFIAFYAGSLTVFFHELREWDDLHPVHISHQADDQAQQLLDQVFAVHATHPPRFDLNLADGAYHGHRLYWSERQDDGSSVARRYELTNTGQAVDVSGNTGPLAGFIYQLHYNAGLPNSWGLYALGIVCLIYGLALLTGLLIFIPNFMKDLFVIRSRKNLKRFWLDTHNVVGVISLPWHIMFAWSSVLLAIGIFLVAPFQALVFKDNLMEIAADDFGLVQPQRPADEVGAILPVKELTAIAKAQVPEFSISRLRYRHAGDVNGIVEVSGTLNERTTLVSRAVVTLSAVDGNVLAVSDPRLASAGSTMYFGLYELHFASFGGYVTRWAYFFLGLAGAYLFYSGNLLWIESRRKRRQSEQRSDARFLAKLNSGVCMGCMAGVSAAFLVSRLTAGLSARGDFVEAAYYAVFFAGIAWAFLRSVAHGARDLLYICAILTAAIPIVDAMVIDMPLWRSAANQRWELLMVNAVAILGAAMFFAMGSGVSRRARRGEANSVWAEPVRPSSPPTTGLGTQK